MSKAIKLILLGFLFALLSLAPNIYAQSNKANPRSGDNPSSENSQKGKKKGHSILIEPAGNKLKVTSFTEDEEGEEEMETEQEVDEIEIELSDNDGEDGDGGDTTVKANGNAAVVIRNKLETQTHFPLRVNTDTNELIVRTPKGDKVVTILPDAAVRNMLAANVLDELGGKGGILYRLENPTPEPTTTATPSAEPSPTATASAEPSPTATASAEPSPTSTASAEPSPTAGSQSSSESPVTLVLGDNDELVYQIKGFKTKKLFGLFNIKINKLVIVSAESGRLLDIEQSFFNDLKSTFSLS